MACNNYKKAFGLAFFALLISQPLCAQTQTINNIELKVIDCAEKPQETLISAGNNPIKAGQFLQKGIHPVRLKITNNSKNPIIISPKSVQKKQIKADKAAEMFHIDHVLTESVLAEACVLGIITLPFFGLPGVAYWYGVNNFIKTTNEQLDQAFAQAFAEKKKGKSTIKPGSTVTKTLLFKEDDESLKFTFQLFDEEEKETVASFEIAL